METQDKRTRILVIDDDILMLNLVCFILNEEKYHIDTALRGRDGLAKLYQSNDYDLILLDIDMPEMDGFEVCRRIRADENLKEIPVVFLTGNASSANIIKGFEVGAQDYITKPFNPKEFVIRSEMHIQLKQKTDLLKDMFDVVEKSNKEMHDSIVYAKYIQHAMFSSTNLLVNKPFDYFILHKPKDIVSGDFYWFKQIKNVLYFAAADCTGHGVAGAFMSILGMSMLNELVTNEKTSKPNEMLNEMRRKIKKTLHQYGQDADNNYGIDISLCSLNLDTKQLYFAGAFNPLYIIRNAENGKVEFITLPADRMPIGVYPVDHIEFTNQELLLQSGDSLYLFSDGYSAQFGGVKNEKFKTRRFKELLIKHHNQPICLQKDLLDSTIEEWRGINDQVDDILVLGLHLL